MVASTGKVADRLRELSKSQPWNVTTAGPRRIYRGGDGFEYYSVTSILSATAAPEKQAALARNGLRCLERQTPNEISCRTWHKSTCQCRIHSQNRTQTCLQRCQANAMCGHPAMMALRDAQRTSPNGPSTKQRRQHRVSPGPLQVLLAGYATSCSIE